MRSIAATQTSARTGTGRDDWQTPECALDRVRKVAPIRLDPCSSGDDLVGAYHSCTEGGIEFSWSDFMHTGLQSLWGLVYVNPPYSHASEWAAKVAGEASQKIEIVSLVPARPDARWFYRLAWDTAQAICFWKGRLRFVGAPSSAPFPSAFVYHGERPWAFEAAFHDAGKVVRL